MTGAKLFLLGGSAHAFMKIRWIRGPMFASCAHSRKKLLEGALSLIPKKEVQVDPFFEISAACTLNIIITFTCPSLRPCGGPLNTICYWRELK